MGQAVRVAFSETPTPTYIVVGTVTRKVSRRFPSRTVTLFAPDDSYLGTRKFMDLLTTHTQSYPP